MPGKAQTFRIFVSSTFSDLKAERNALQAFVFPRLRELCENQGTRFQPIDLRWGVSNEASLDQQAMNICLGEVDRCQKISPRPNFIVLLGDRYGWMPPAAQIPSAEYEKIIALVTDNEKALLNQWYTLDNNAVPSEYRLNPREKGGPYEPYENWQPIETELQRIISQAVDQLPFRDDRKLLYQASATHQEILAGALKQTGAPEHVFCFFRHLTGLPHAFNLTGFLDILSSRLAIEYPQGLSTSCMALVDAIRGLPVDASPADVQAQIKQLSSHVYEATDEESLLQFIQQALLDYIAKDFINLDEETQSIDEDAFNRLSALKNELKSKFQANMFIADQVRWLGDQLPSERTPYKLITTDHIGSLPANLSECMFILEEGYTPKNLCEALFRSLGKVILSEIEHPHHVPGVEEKILHIQPHEALDEEGFAHHAFAEERLTYFVGREKILTAIGAYTQNPGGQILTIFGEGGTGKSALIAKAVERTQQKSANAHLVYRFIGATPGSSDARSLLSSLCHEISRCYGAPEDDIPLDYRDLVSDLMKRLALSTHDNPLILFIDSLDQLSPNHNARGLNWLPSELPDAVSLIISTRREKDILDGLTQKQRSEMELGGLDDEDGEILLKQWLADIQRELQEDQSQEILSKFKKSKNNPLYLKLAFEEARRWTSYQDPREVLAENVVGIIRENMIDRLKDEGNHGDLLVSRALGYLAASRYGLAEDELVDLLSRDLDVYEWFFKQTYHLPSDLVQMAVAHLQAHPEALQNLAVKAEHDLDRLAINWLKQDRTPPEPVMDFLRNVLQKPEGPRLPIVLWSRLSFDLAPYLSERLVDGSALLNFYHRELKDVSEAEFLTEEQAPLYHAKLASYFRVKADPQEDRSWNGGYIHGLSELPYHLTKAGERDQVYELLIDFNFLEHKAEEVGITKRIEADGREEITSEGVQDLQQDLQFALRTFYGGGEGGSGERAPLILTAKRIEGKLLLFCPVCKNTYGIQEDMLGDVISCSNADCQAQLKLNPFVTEIS